MPLRFDLTGRQEPDLVVGGGINLHLLLLAYLRGSHYPKGRYLPIVHGGAAESVAGAKGKVDAPLWLANRIHGRARATVLLKTNLVSLANREEWNYPLFVVSVVTSDFFKFCDFPRLNHATEQCFVEKDFLFVCLYAFKHVSSFAGVFLV